MNNYNLTLVLKPDLEENKRKELLESVTKRFGQVVKADSAQASTVKEDLWGNRDLSYPIKHQKKGYYVHYTFEALPDKIAPLDKALKINEDVIRYLLVRL